MIKKITGHIKRSIGNKYITAFLLFLVLPIVILSVFFTISLRTMLTDNEYQNMNDRINYSGTSFDEMVLDMNNIVSSAVVNDDIMKTLKSANDMPTYEWFKEWKVLENLLLSLSTKNHYTYHISILSSDGKLYRSGIQYNSMLNLKSNIVQKLLDDENGQFLVNRKLEGIDDNNVITFGKKIMQGGEMLGIMLVDVSVSSLHEMFNLFDSNFYDVYIFNEDNHLLYSFDETLTNSTMSKQLKQQILSNNDLIYVDGKPNLSIMRASKSDKTKTAVLVPESIVYSSSNKLVIVLAIAISIVIMGTISIIILLSNRISHNIKFLSKAVSDYGRTGISTDIIIHSDDEVGQLTKGFLSMQGEIETLILQMRQDEQTKWKLKFQALQSQINPHMIYNTLNTITYLAQLQNIKNIEEVSISFSKLLRMVSKRKDDFITIREEIECLKAYLTIKKYNLTWDVEAVFDIDDEILDCRILKLLIQPLIENSMVHGFSETHMEGKIIIVMRKLVDKIYIKISDNGIGMSSEKLQNVLECEQISTNSFANIGIRNTIDRLKLQYGEDSTFLMESEENVGTSTNISYPAQYFEKE